MNPIEKLATHPTVSVPEAAEMLSISRGGVYKMVEDGRLGHVRIGARVVVTTESLRDLIYQR